MFAAVLADWSWIVTVKVESSKIDIRLANWSRIDGLVMDWQIHVTGILTWIGVRTLNWSVIGN